MSAQLNIANPATGKQKLIDIEDDKKLCAAAPCCAASVVFVSVVSHTVVHARITGNYVDCNARQ